MNGGAYGGFCDFDDDSGNDLIFIYCHMSLFTPTYFPSFSGVFSYLSYRDPNLLKTLDVYDATANFLLELELDDDALTKAIIGTIGEVNSYQLPAAKGYTR